MCEFCSGYKTPHPGWPYAPHPTDDAVLAQNVRNAMQSLATATDAARKAGLVVDFTALFTGGFSPVAVVPGSIHLNEISRTTTQKVVL